eukprot:365800-Chlamydomonas_euryale.AAC.22
MGIAGRALKHPFPHPEPPSSSTLPPMHGPKAWTSARCLLLGTPERGACSVCCLLSRSVAPPPNPRLHHETTMLTNTSTRAASSSSPARQVRGTDCLVTGLPTARWA